MNLVIPFVRKLRNGAPLTAEDESLLTRLAEPARRVPRGDVVREGSGPPGIPVVLDGWVCRYRQLPSGKRQVTSLYVPGDLCEPFGILPKFMDDTLAALTPATLTMVPQLAIRKTVHASRRIEDALWWDLLVANGIEREWIVSLGRRTATERLGHFFCEIHCRLKMVDLVDGPSFDMPLTQNELADLFGLSAVHVNRSLQELRGCGLLTFRNRRATLPDIDELRELSMFDPAYLFPPDKPNGGLAAILT